MGDHALLVLLDDAQSAAAVAGFMRDTGAGGAAAHLSEPRDVVPAARTVLLDGLPDRAAVAAWAAWLAEAAPPSDKGSGSPGLAPVIGRPVVIETVYDGADLAEIATAWGCSRDAVVARHEATVFVVAFCGFAPGFAYCLPRSPLPSVPRRVVPRERVPAGSVALGGEFCGVYPRPMPGGWQLLGATAAVMFDPQREPPALLTPGDAVRFRAVRPGAGG